MQTRPEEEQKALQKLALRYFNGALEAKNLALVTCNHYVLDASEIFMGNPEQGYSKREARCPICKFPTSVQLAIYRSEVVDKLYHTKLIDANMGTLYSLIDLHIEGIQKQESVLYFSKQAYDPADIEALVAEAESTLKWSHNFFYAPDHWKEIRRYSKLEDCTQLSARIVIGNDSIRSFLEYSEIRGAAEAAHELGEVYSGVYLMTYLFMLGGQSEIPDHRKMWGMLVLSSTATLLFIFRLIVRLSHFKEKAEDSSSGADRFKRLDVNELYLILVTNLVYAHL